MLKTETYTLPAQWASALINADVTGLEEEEELALNEWLDLHNPGTCLSCTEEPSFRKYHDAQSFVLACDCLDFEFVL